MQFCVGNLCNLKNYKIKNRRDEGYADAAMIAGYSCKDYHLKIRGKIVILYNRATG